jgi:hypothetical protein
MSCDVILKHADEIPQRNSHLLIQSIRCTFKTCTENWVNKSKARPLGDEPNNNVSTLSDFHNVKISLDLEAPQDAEILRRRVTKTEH